MYIFLILTLVQFMTLCVNSKVPIWSKTFLNPKKKHICGLNTVEAIFSDYYRIRNEVIIRSDWL